MKEEDLVDLGFVRTDVTSEESGDLPFYYYNYDLTKSTSLISCDDEEAKSSGWYVEFFEDECVRFTDYDKLKSIIALIDDAKVR